MSTIKSSQVVRNMVADTWRWLWPDTLMRVIPLAAIPFLYVAIFHLPLAFLGLTLHNWPQQLIIGLVVGVVMTFFAITYRILIVGPWFRWPTPADHLLQGFFYLVINGPAEELFFRGFLLYLAQPEPRSLLAVVIVHGFTTWGFLSLGDEVMYRRWKRKQA